MLASLNPPAEDIAEAAIRTRARVALSVVFPAGDMALEDELRRLRTMLPKDVTLVVGGATASAYSEVLNEIGAERLNDLEDFERSSGLRRARRPRR